MVFQEKIQEETPVFVRIALKYRGMRLSEIMEKCGRCRSTVCIILKEVIKRICKEVTCLLKRELAERLGELSACQKTSPFKAHHHLTSRRREIHCKKVNGKNGFENERILLSHYAMVPSYRDIKFGSLGFA